MTKYDDDAIAKEVKEESEAAAYKILQQINGMRASLQSERNVLIISTALIEFATSRLNQLNRMLTEVSQKRQSQKKQNQNKRK